VHPSHLPGNGFHPTVGLTLLDFRSQAAALRTVIILAGFEPTLSLMALDNRQTSTAENVCDEGPNPSKQQV